MSTPNGQSFQLLPDLTAEEFAALKADIAKRGVMVPIEQDEAGELLDGHHRQRAVADLAAEGVAVVMPDPVIRSGWTDNQKREHVLKINLLRRHMGPIGWAKAFDRLLAERGVRRGQGSRNDTTTSLTVRQVAAELGVKRATAYRRLELADELKNDTDLVAKVDSGEMEAKRARRVARERQADEKRATQGNVLDLPPVPDVDFRHGDFRTVLAELAPGSVDLILTDPPYPQEFLPLWEALAEHAGRWLKPDGLLVALTGQYHLPAVMAALSSGNPPSLRYRWCGTLLTTGPAYQAQHPKVRSQSKPLLFYMRQDAQPSEWIEDTYRSTGEEKGGHDWQQNLAAYEQMVQRLSRPGALILDPFLGAGTTAVAAFRHRRRFVGCDIDAAAVATARERVG